MIWIRRNAAYRAYRDIGKQGILKIHKYNYIGFGGYLINYRWIGDIEPESVWNFIGKMSEE